MRVAAPLALLAASAAAAATAAPAPVGGGRGLILFWSDRARPALWSIRPDGSRARMIFRTPRNAKRPVLSPDGRWVAFDGAPPGKAPLADFDVQIVRLDGTRRRTVAGTTAREIDAQWSPDGRLLGFTRSGPGGERPEIWIVRPDGTHAARLGPGQIARWAPDGRRIVFSLGMPGDLFVMNSDGTGRRRLTRTPEHEEPAAWSRSGEILFTRYASDGSGRASIWALRVGGRDARRLTPYGPGQSAADWSPDASRILFTSERTGHPQVFVMDADGSSPRNLSRSPFDDYATSWR